MPDSRRASEDAPAMFLPDDGLTLGNMESSKTSANLASLGRLAFDIAAETLWPTRCAVCDLPGSLLCDDCANDLPFIDACRACPRCGTPFGSVQCTECNPVMLAASEREEPPFTQMACATVFAESTRRIVTVYKDSGERRLAREVLSPLMARYLSPTWTKAGGSVALTYIPATRAALRRRGFDHAELLAGALATQVGLACIPLLARPGSSDQRKLSRRERIANMRRRFGVLPGASIPETVIVIDDVCTTGATLFSAADALSEAGAEHVYALAFARVWD